jgi:hypothetical protein
MKRNLVEVPDGVRFVVVILHVFKNMIYTYVDNVLEKLLIPWDLKN